jgi:hypothetical protein
MIPDKIYIPIIEEDGKKLICTNWWETDARSRYVNETIPYIRKDALFEMLKGYSHPLTRVVVQELIDKINEL